MPKGPTLAAAGPAGRFCLLFLLVVLCATPARSETEYKISPSTGVPGKEYDIKVFSPGCQPKNLKGAKLDNRLRGTGVSVENQESSDCLLTGKLTVAADAPVGDVLNVLLVVKTDTEVLGTATFTVVASLPGPIPPGLKPQVDIMWSLVPRKIVRDNFGHYIDGRYYCIEVVIGNNSGYSLQIASVGFQPGLDHGRKPDDPTPAEGYRMVRGTLQKMQLVGTRAMIVNSIRGLGPILTGIGPFFHNINHKANYEQGINIFSNPFEKGLELIFPDTIVGQLARLDDQVLRDGLVVPNNTQVRTVVFFGKRNLSFAAKHDYDDHKKVLEALQTLVLVGHTIQYLNRVRVEAAPPGPVTPPPTVFDSLLGTFKQGDKDKPLLIRGTNLNNATLPSEVDGVQFTDVKPDANGRGLTAKVSVAETATPGRRTILISTAAGAATSEINIEKK